MSAPSSYNEIWAWSNLWAAWREASRGKRGQATVAAFELRLEDQLLSLQQELQQRVWRPGAYTSFFIHEPKRRLISAAPFRDRVVHHALCQVTAPALERRFTADSFANRIGFGTHRAVDVCQRLARRHPYVLAMDVRQFFPSIDHEILREQLSGTIRDPEILDLVGHILAGGEGILRAEYSMAWFPGDDLLAAIRPRGLPIGNLTSQLWANCFLTPFDHFVKRELRCPGYVRYVDDFRLFADDRKTLWDWRTAIVARLAEFRLTVHPGAQPRRVDEGISFLGFRLWPDRRRLKRRKVVYAVRRLRQQAREVAAGSCTLARFQDSLRAWLNHASHANTIGLRKAILRSLVVRGASAARRSSE